MQGPISTSLLTLILSLSFCFQAFPQAAANQLRQADDLFANGSYATALPVYLEILEKDPEHALFNYKAGVCYLHSRSQKTKSVPYLEKAVNNSPSWITRGYPGDNEAPVDAFRLLADAYYLSYNFPAALKAYERYSELLKESKTPNPGEIAATETRLSMCRLIKGLQPTMMLPISASTGHPCNGDLLKGEYSASLSPDKNSMIYTVKVPLGKTTSGLSDYYEPLKTKPADSLAQGTLKKQTASPVKKFLEIDSVVYATTIGTSVDGQVVLSYRNEKDEGNLYIIRLKDNKWTMPVKMPKPANKKGWEPHETLTADGSTMYFVSEVPGGFGGKDLYRCDKQSNGEWSKAYNLGHYINTEADEVAPFIHPDGKTLFFSSNRNKPGSFDIYASRKTGDNWEQPLNVGYPVNRHDHDIFQVTADNRKTPPAPRPEAEKLAQAKRDTMVSAPGPDRSNYLISFINPNKVPLTILKGQVASRADRHPLAARIILTDNSSGEIIGSYHADSKTGLYSFIIPFGKNVGITYESEGYLFQTEKAQVNEADSYFDKQQTVLLPLLAEGATTTLNSVYFENFAATPNTASTAELNRLVKFLNNHPGISVEIASHLYSAAGKKQIKKLSQARAEAITGMLAAKGIHPARMKARGYRHAPREPESGVKDAVKSSNKKGKEAIPEDEQVLELTLIGMTEQKKNK